MFSSYQDCVINRELDVVITSKQELNAAKSSDHVLRERHIIIIVFWITFDEMCPSNCGNMC